MSRDSPVLHQRDAWSRENDNPRTPDSGLAPSLTDSKNSEGAVTGWARTDSPNGSSSKGSHGTCTGSSEDKFGETLAQPQSTLRYTTVHITRVNTASKTVNNEVEC